MIKQFFLLGMVSVLLCNSPLPVHAQNGYSCKPGPRGLTGLQGPAGNMGPQGSMGPQGFQGPVGDAGPCCAAGINTYANLFSITTQTLSALGIVGDAVIFDGVNAVAGIGTTSAAITGEIIILSPGTYQIDYSVDVAPVPGAWSVALFLDGNFITGSASAASNNDLDETITNSCGGVIINISAGQRISLRNNNGFTIILLGTIAEEVQPIASGSINILKLENL